MASKKTDPFNRRLRKPRSLKMAHLVGEAAIVSLKKFTLDRRTDGPLTMEEEAMVVHLGHAIGEGMFRDNCPWTLNEFITRLGKLASAA